MSVDIQQARAWLEQRRRRLVASWKTGQLEEGELIDDRRPEWNELAAEQHLAELVDRLGEREVRALREIVAALARLDAGTWGVCERCGETIADARLRALPEARTCAACAPEATAPTTTATVELDDERFVTDVADAIRGYDESVWGTCRRCGQALEAPGHEYCADCERLVETGAALPPGKRTPMP